MYKLHNNLIFIKVYYFDSFGAVSIAVHFLKEFGLTDDECYKIMSNPTNDNTIMNDLVPKSLGRNLLYHMQDNHK